MPKGRYSLLQSFGFAFRGIAYALKHERNLRIHVSAAMYILYFSIVYHSLTSTEYAMLLLVIGLVITCELFNTAIEKTVDIETPAWNSLAKIAKDVAAGAVLVSSITAIIVGVLLLWNPETAVKILSDIKSHWLIWCVVLTVNAIWIFWKRRL